MPALVLPIDARSVAAARRFLRDVLDGHQASAIDDAVLMISELVTNAVRHAQALLQIMVSIVGQTLHVEVSDDDPTQPSASTPDQNATSGRGLRIVDDLADHWGVIHNTDGKTVWLEIHLSPANP